MLALGSVNRHYFQLCFLAYDLVAIVISFGIAHRIRFGMYHGEFLSTPTFLVICSVVVIINYIFSLYEPLRWQSRLFSPWRIAFAHGLALLVLFAGIFLISPLQRGGLIGRGVLLGAFFCYGLFSLAGRKFFDHLLLKGERSFKWLFIGLPRTQEVLKNDLSLCQMKIQLDWIDSSEEEKNLSKKIDKLLHHHWSSVIVERSLPEEYLKKVMDLRFRGQPVLSVQQFYENLWFKVPIFTLDSNWFAFSGGFTIFQNKFYGKLKRLGDLVIAVPMLIVLAPILLILALLVYLDDPGPVIFRQSRMGEGGKLFTIYKFRSMVHSAEKNGPQWAQPNDPRITHIGRILRISRLDELPQLINIIRGEMSFVGPRPERNEFVMELAQKIPYYDLRHLVKPGLTGWAQVMYPYGSSLEDAIEKLQYELYYIKNYSPILDLKIFLKTVSVVLFGKGR